MFQIDSGFLCCACFTIIESFRFFKQTVVANRFSLINESKSLKNVKSQNTPTHPTSKKSKNQIKFTNSPVTSEVQSTELFENILIKSETESETGSFGDGIECVLGSIPTEEELNNKEYKPSYDVQTQSGSTTSKAKRNRQLLSISNSSLRLEKTQTNNSSLTCFICDYCGLSNKTKIAFIRHLKTHLKAKTERFPCDRCKRTFAVKVKLISHNNTQHPESGEFLCPNCNSIFSSIGKLREHQRHIKCFVTNKKYNYQPKLMICDHCGKFVQVSRIKTHIRRVHEKIKKHFCSVIINL